TIPLLRYLEKYAVYTGGGTNHRMGLYDQVLIKDNHISFQLSTAHLQQKKGERTVKEIVEFCRKKVLRGTVVEVEVETLKDFELALAAKPDIIMLDNMRPSDIKACVEIRKLAKAKPSLEASGGITLGNIEEYAKTGVDMISVGSLTSSVKSIDMSLAIVR
nr:nicotinate-nucleotide diphosphorylase (carboxylating) [Candidatus Omnitrophota bacterium]